MANKFKVGDRVKTKAPQGPTGVIRTLKGIIQDIYPHERPYEYAILLDKQKYTTFYRIEELEPLVEPDVIFKEMLIK